MRTTEYELDNVGTISAVLCLDRIITLSERYIRRFLKECVEYYSRCRVHQPLGMGALEGNAPEGKKT